MREPGGKTTRPKKVQEQYGHRLYLEVLVDYWGNRKDGGVGSEWLCSFPRNSNKKRPSGALTRVPGPKVDLAGTQGMQEVGLNKDLTSFQTVPSPSPQR